MTLQDWWCFAWSHLLLSLSLHPLVLCVHSTAFARTRLLGIEIGRHPDISSCRLFASCPLQNRLPLWGWNRQPIDACVNRTEDHQAAGFKTAASPDNCSNLQEVLQTSEAFFSAETMGTHPCFFLAHSRPRVASVSAHWRVQHSDLHPITQFLLLFMLTESGAPQREHRTPTDGKTALFVDNHARDSNLLPTGQMERVEISCHSSQVAEDH